MAGCLAFTVVVAGLPILVAMYCVGKVRCSIDLVLDGVLVLCTALQ